MEPIDHMEIDLPFLPNPFDFLPMEVILRIFNFLEEKPLTSAGSVCKFWNALAWKECYDRGMYDMEVLQDNFAAIEKFSTAIAINCNAAMAYFKRGVAHYKENEDEEALRDINKALGLQPTQLERHLITGMKHQINLNYAEAVEEASKVIAMDPMNGSAYYLRGYNRFDLQDYEGSIGDLTYCLQLPYPYKSKVFNCRGWCFKIIGEIDKAVVDFTHSARLNVRYTKPFVNKAIVLSTKRDKNIKLMEEEQFLTETLERLKATKEGNLGAIFYTRAAIKQQFEQYLTAIEDYQAAIQHNYHSPHKAHVSIGWCYEKLHKYERAIEHYDVAIKLKPSYSISIEHRAGAKCRTDSKAGEDDCRLAIVTNPKNLSFAFRYLAAVQADRNDHASAIATLSEGIKHNKYDTDILLNRAGYYTCKGDLQGALADYDICLKHRPDTLEGWKYRGNVRFALGDLFNAISDYEKVLKMDPADSTVVNNCAIAHMGMGNFAGASSLLQRKMERPLPAFEENLRLLRVIEDTKEVPRLFEPMLCCDPVFERDIEQRMKEAARTKLQSLLKPPMSEQPQRSYLAKMLDFSRRTPKG